MMKPTEEDEAMPFSCSTSLSKDVLAHLAKKKLGSAAWDFCAVLHNHTFGDAGFHRKMGHREWWCRFDMATWAAELDVGKSNLMRVITELEACNIIFYLPDPERPGSGRIGWNIHFDEWQSYDSRRAKGRFAKDLEKQPNVFILRATAPEATFKQNDSKEVEALENDGPSPLLAIRKINTAGSLQENEASGKINTPASPGEQEIAQNKYGSLLKINTAGSSKRQDSSALAEGVIKDEKKEGTEESTPNGVAAPVAHASRVSVEPIASSSQELQQGSMFEGKPKEDTGAKPSASNGKRAKRVPTPEVQELTERKAALAKIWLEHPSPRVMKPQYPSGWSQFNGGIKALAEEDGIQPEEQLALIDAMLTWSKGTYQPTPMKMHRSLDDVNITLMQLQAKKGANHAGRNSHQTSQRRNPEPGGAGQPEYSFTEDEYGAVTILSVSRADSGPTA